MDVHPTFLHFIHVKVIPKTYHVSTRYPTKDVFFFRGWQRNVLHNRVMLVIVMHL